MSFSAQSVPRKNPRVAARIVEESAVLVVLDRRAVHRLDEVGSRVWELCEDRSVDQIAERVAEEYGVGRQQVLSDVLPFLNELCDLGAVMPEEP